MNKKEDYIDACIREMAHKALDENKVFEYFLFWKNEPSGWQEKAKKILREEIKRK